jgi:hypothetical protein
VLKFIERLCELMPIKLVDTLRSVLLGNIPDVYPDFVGNVTKLHEQYGPVIRLYLGG